MKLTCNRDNLIEGINIVQRAVASKSTNPVLEGIYIDVTEEMVLSGNDTELGITCEVPAIIEEIGSLVVSSKTFGDIVRKLPDTFVSLETDDTGKMIIIKSGSSKSMLRLIPAESFPKVNPIDSTNSIEVKSSTLIDMIKQTSFAAAIGDARPNLKGVYLEKIPGMLNMVAVDGYRLAFKYIEHQGNESIGALIPPRTLNELSRIISRSDEMINILCNDTSIMFCNERVKIISKLIRENFIDYKNTIPKDFNTKAAVSTAELLSAVERASLIILDDKRSSLIFNIDEEGIFISSTSDFGQTAEKVNAQVSGSPLTIAFTPKNMIDCLRAVEAENIIFSFTIDRGPAIIRNDGVEDDFTCLIMPVKVNNR